MKRKWFFTVFYLLVAFAMLGIVTVFALDAGSLNWWTVDGGGATSSTGGSYNLAGSIGQLDTGTSTGETYALVSGFWNVNDNIPPTVLSITRADTNPSIASSVNFTVTFSEVVTGVDVADFKLTTTLLTGTSVASVSGSDSTYTITVNTGSGNGTIRLDLPATSTIQDLSSNRLVEPFTNGETYTINKRSAPTVPVLKSPANKALVDTYAPTLDWKDSTAIMALANDWSYELNVSDGDSYNQTFNTASGLSNSSYTFTVPLAPNTTYTWKVRAYNGSNQYSVWSTSRTFRTKPQAVSTKLDTPTLLLPANASTLDNKRPIFTWNAVTGASSYSIQILRDGKSVKTARVTIPTFTLTSDLLPATAYTWTVRAVGPVPSDTSAPFSFTTSANPPDIPVLVSPIKSALLDSTASINLSWKAVLANPKTSAPPAASYQVEYASNSSFSSSITQPVDTNSLTLPAGSLNVNTVYYWRVRSWSAAGAAGTHSAWSTVRVFRTRLPVPTLNSPTDGAQLDSRRPTFLWDEVPGATSYTLQVLKGSKVILTATTKNAAYSFTPSTDLPASTALSWRVKAGGANPGDFSAPFTFTTSINTPAVPTLISPKNKALVDASVTQTFQWKTVTNALSYDLEYATNASFLGSTLVQVAVPQSAPISMSPGRTYYWRVRSWSGIASTGVHSAWSAVFAVNVKFEAPVLSTPADGSSEVSSTPTFSWTSNNAIWTSHTLQIATDNQFKKNLKTFTIPAPNTSFTLPAASALPGGTFYWRVKINGSYSPAFSSPFSMTAAISLPFQADWQIQYSGNIDLSLNVKVYNLDLFETSSAVITQLQQRGIFVMCYFSAGSYEDWRPDAGDFPPVTLGKDMEGWPGEKWLDIRQIDLLKPIMEARLNLAVQKGCNGVDPDNVNGYSNDTGFPLTGADQLVFNKFLAQAAHQRGLKIGLKNDIEQIPELVEYFDWELNEECFAFDECETLLPFIEAGKPVFVIEYTTAKQDVCPLARQMQFNAILKKQELGAFRISCTP